MKPLILERWDRLGDSDLACVEGRFDRLIEVIRAQYYRGRSTITIEGEIRDWLLGTLKHIENSKE